MAMNKKEKAAYNAALHKAELTAALRWTEEVQKDVMPPAHSSSSSSSSSSSYTVGWVFNANSKLVEKAWSQAASHGTGDAPGVSTNKVFRSQHPIEMFSSKLLALKAMRHEVEIAAARELLSIDERIKQLSC